MREDIGTPAMTPQQEMLTGSKKSGLDLYKELAVGQASWIYLVFFELAVLLLGNLSGILGYGLRSIFYKFLFKTCGKRPGFGKGTILRQPNNIVLGNKILLDDYASLDVRGKNGQIEVFDHVSIGRFSSIIAKDSQIKLGKGVNVGAFTRIASQSKVEIGESVLIAAYCYIGPGNHQLGDESVPLISKAMQNKGGVKIGAHAWIGTRATILDGVTIGEGAIIGAHSLVTSDIPARSIAVGTPAKVIKMIDQTK